ncbi:MAG: hypothetical protein NT015_18485 [Alphaproteobacteria bacterium]|nr:hypothetical protein [Alphaproteobacteria bacterium]
MRYLLPFVASLALMGCGGQQQQSAQQPDARVPEWAQAYVGRNFADVFQLNTDCIGSVDAVVERFADGGERIQGWAWNRTAQAAYPNLIAVDPQGVVNGVGTTNAERPDVVEARSDVVTSPSVGYEVRTLNPAAPSAVYAVDPATQTACLLGRTTL